MKKILSILTFFLLFSLLATGIQITELRSAGTIEKFRLFTIALDKTSYKIGEKVKITDVQPIYFQCDEGVTVWVFLKQGDSILERTGQKLGKIGYVDGFISVTQGTSYLSAGTYTIESLWQCGNNIYIDKNGDAQPLTPKAYSSRKSFTLVNEKTTPPKQECPLSECPMGYKQVNWNSPGCKCQLAFQDGDGKCNIGEPQGTLDCSKPNTPSPTSSSNKLLFIFGGVVFLVGAYFALKK